MSIYARNFIVDELTFEVKLIKHLNKIRIDRFGWTAPGGWNKSGKKARMKKGGINTSKSWRRNLALKKLNDLQESND